MKPDERDDAAALMVLVALGLIVVVILGASAFLAFSRYSEAMQ